MLFFGIPFSALPAFVFFNLVGPQWHKTEWSVLLLVLSFMGFFGAIGVGLLLSPLWAYWKASRTVYAITDQRCIIIAASRRRTIYSYLAARNGGEIVDLHRIEDTRGRGDLVFHRQAVSGKRGIYYYNVGFVGIQDVREAEVRVRDLLASTRTV
nr:hypothetical protein [Verrucomicrobiota bacterium]